MADQKLTDLTPLPSDLAAGDLIYVVRSGTDYQANVNQLGGAAVLDVGTTAGTVAAGDDSRIVAGGTALQPNGSAALLTSFPTLNQNTTGTAAGLSAVLVPASGGTGVANNNASTLTISGNFATTLTVSDTTAVTLPTSGTLATTAQLTADPVTAAAVIADGAVVVGSGGARGVAASTLTGIPLLTTGVPSASNVTNDAQTKASIVPNTAPAAGEILVGNAGGTAYAKAAVSGDATLASTGALTIANDAVTNAKMANMAANTVKGRITGSTGDPEDLTAANVRTILGFDSQKTTIWVPADSMRIRTTSGAPAGATETSTNKVMLGSLDFDAASDEFAQFTVAMPKSWDEGTVTAQFVWTHGSTVTNFGVVWGLQGLARSNDDAADTAFGTAQTVTDAGGTADDIYISDETSAITIGGTPAEGDVVWFQVYRDADAGGDTLAVDAKLLGVKLYITLNAITDA